MTGDRTPPDPSIRQRVAADPAASAWVSASAGSGKTKVLTDRVLSLLLNGTAPERMLCLTFTKAAAAEMSIRINRQLSRWATEPDEPLRAELSELSDAKPDDTAIRNARRLFARVLDVPGGLKIQTIHGFCQSLLGRFPIEAGLAPHFEVLDERSAAELLDAARDRVLLRAEADAELTAALATVTEHVDEQRFAELMAALGFERHRLERFLEGAGGFDAARRTIRDRLGLKPGESDETVLRDATADNAIDHRGLGAAAEGLLRGTEKTDRPRGQAIADWLAADPGARTTRVDDYASNFLTAAGEPRKVLATKGVLAANPEIETVLAIEAERIHAMQQRRRAIVVADATTAMIRLGGALLEAYAEAKRSLARLDYDDLILKAAHLLHRPGVAPWVLFKLDGGLDHILVDEAQDTSPQQWSVIAALSEEFFAGQSAREVTRTIFAVGDMKQSIFSFQHADPDEFRHMRDHFAKRVRSSGGEWRPVELDVSFRSAQAVLDAVDCVFSQPDAADGVVEPGAVLHHFAHRSGHAGVVEQWPSVGPRGEAEDEPWSPPVSRRAGDDPKGRLARVLAARIRNWIGHETLEARGRTVRAGDIMVLVRTRTAFVEALVRALKDLGVPVSGVDRMVLTEQIAVMDLVALGRFLLLPEDDLTLATVLKGPLIGFDDDDLFRLAWQRQGRSLWQRLGDEATDEPRYESARKWLAHLLSRVDYVRPFELYAEILSKPTVSADNGRRRMLAQLGPDADDPIDEFLNLALAYQRGHAAALEGFLHWLEAGEATVKRDLEQSGRDEVRVMTVHGSKGLQAPIVILPDTMSKPRVSPMLIWDGDVPLWAPRSVHRETIVETLLDELKRRQEQEYRRLLYVAMTRAEDRLYVCGAEGRTSPADDCWYGMVRRGLAERAKAVQFDFSEPAADGWKGTGLRLALPQKSAVRPDQRFPAETFGAVPEEDWMLRPAPAEPTPPRPLAPSQHTEAEPSVRSPVGDDQRRRFHRGILIHRLLEVLPDIASADRLSAAERFLSRPVHGLGEAERKQIAAEVVAVIEHPDYAAVFGSGSRAEVPITGVIQGPNGKEVVSGQVDRLIVAEDAVTIVDFKSNRPPPETADAVPALYWHQMAAYREVIAQIYPDRRIECALLWTDGPSFMRLSGPRLDRAISRP